MKILCGQCGQTSLADDETAAGLVECGHCGHQIGTNGSIDMMRPVFEGDSEDQAFGMLMKEALNRKIHVNCGSCGRGLKVSLRMAGRKTSCPACGQRVQLPLAGQEAERRIEEYIARRRGGPGAGKAAARADKAGSLMHFDESELKELATFVDTDNSDDISLDIPEEDDFMRRSAEAMDGREILALNAAVSAVVPQRGSAAEDLPKLQQAVKEHPTRSTAGMSTQTKAVIMTAAAAVIIGIGLWAAISFMGGSPPVDPDFAPDVPPLAVNPDKGDGTPKSPGDGTVKKPIITKPIVDPVVKPKPVKLLANCRAVTSTIDSFAAGGFFPAAPGDVYCRISVQVKAGDDELELFNFGQTAVLKIGLESYPSLGEPAAASSILPTLPKKKRLDISPGQSRTLTMLFQVPHKVLGASGARGVIMLGTMPPVGVKLGNPAHVLPAEAVASKPYTEIAPRNTKPLLRDPVMSAIQNRMPQKLSILPGDGADSISLKLGSGEVSGSATRDSRGLYVARLNHNGDTLDCLLRFAYGGSQAILYLSDEPFHQLTFAQPGWSGEVPIIPQGPGSGIINPRPPGVKPKPVAPKPKPTPPKNGGRRPGSGFFGV